MIRRNRPQLGALFYFLGMIMLGLYFTFAAVQGDYGLFKRIEVRAEGQALEEKLAGLQSDVRHMENLTTRLSDNYLDLDLLDQQARDVLGLIRADEIVIR